MAEAKDLVRKFLDMSTAHLSQELLDMLEQSPDGDCPMSASPTPHGYFVWVNEDLQEAVANGVPMDMAIIFRAAQQMGCDYILFDGDARECDYLPILNPEMELGPDEQAEQIKMRDAAIDSLRSVWALIDRSPGGRGYTGPDPDGLDRDNLGETPEPADRGDVEHD